MSELRIIKKYPNRRLYDTFVSSYITLADVKRLVIDNEPFAIQDAKTGEDITRLVLLQIIVEQEERGDHLFSNGALEELIRFYGGTFQGIMGSYLENSFKLFAQQQEKVQEQIQKQNPLALFSEVTDRNFKIWKEMQETFFKSATSVTKKEEKEKK
jgi:polyhydroxyalkanoate synthesis repressor PhaR